MILGNVLYKQSPMVGKEFRNPFSFVPTGLIYPKLNQHSLITSKDVLEHGKEPIGIPFGLTQHPMGAPDGIHPSKDIKPLVMLALGTEPLESPPRDLISFSKFFQVT